MDRPHLADIPLSLISYPASLPIVEKQEEIVAAIRSHQVIVIAGETGSGKTTQIPKMCIEAGIGKLGMIGCTQPRRIAALSISRRIADELSVTWGREVGCKIRFSDNTAPQTVIKVMTDGVLLGETRSDPLLSRYEAIIIDEAHERSLNIDFLLGYLRGLVTKRPDLKVIITSATIDTALFSRAFNDAPVFEVSGRLFPVEVRYHPLVRGGIEEGMEEGDEEPEEITYVDGAIEAVEEIVRESREGDLLVFMPTERDIIETRDRLIGRFNKSLEVLPLMGSLSAAEQERVFKYSPQRKVIVATNIAETSLTIPNIRYVVDTGLARISRYNARTRTKRLPIEPIAKSSAHQRTGRAGRVREGICIRLYREEEFNDRPDYTDPEIVRSNLAEVILRMKAFKLGEIEGFPFLNPPDGRSIRSGYLLLHELGAIDERRELTHIGRELALLPVDPTIGRMIIQSKRDRCLPEMLVIASGLSIQDPRERPLQKREKADEVHRQFAHPDSDFLTLLNIWTTFHSEWRAAKNQSQLRKYCKANFLSYMRMREWTDIHTELFAATASRTKGKRTNEGRNESVAPTVKEARDIKRFDGDYRAIHRSVLSGLLGQIAFRIDRNLYRASANREVFIAPGSAAAEKRGKLERPKQRRSRGEQTKMQWIVAGEIVETSRLFARTVAPVAPAWIEELARHAAHRVIEDPRWRVDAGEVTATERVTLNGLIVAQRRVHYARFNPQGAKELFVIHALLDESSSVRYPFVLHNRRLRDKIGSELARRGRFQREVIEQSLLAFYMERLPPISSLRELEKFVLEDLPHSPDRLLATEQELLGHIGVPNLDIDKSLYPDFVEIGGMPVELHYRYDPSGGRDGATLHIPLALARQVPPRMLDGIVPGFRQKQVEYLVRLLPKEYRSKLPSVEQVIQRIAGDPSLDSGPLVTGIREVLHEVYNVEVPLHLIDFHQLPDHLRPRIEVWDGGHIVAEGRDLAALEGALKSENQSDELPALTRVKSDWERTDLARWDFGDLPERVEAASIGGVTLYLYPGLAAEDGRVALRLFDEREAAERESRAGVDLLLKKSLPNEVRELERQTSPVEAFKPLTTLYLTLPQLKSTMVECALRRMFARELHYPLTERDFNAAMQEAKQRMIGLMPAIMTVVKSCLELRRALLNVKKPYPRMRQDLETLLPADFLQQTPFDQLHHLPRYLRAMLVRVERFDLDPARDRTKHAQVVPYIESLEQISDPKQREEFRWMVEEYKVSTFAQELGTPYPISPKRLDKALQG